MIEEEDPGFARFVEEVAKPDAALDLGYAALLIACMGNPALEPAPWLARLDALAEEANACIPARGSADRAAGLLRFLSDECGLRGNTDAYYDPRNSYLDQVLERKVGIPITLSLVAIEVGKRIGVGLCGVSFPGHFLIRSEGGQIFDPFSGGEPVSDDRLHELLAAAAGEGAELSSELLQPAPKLAILARMLRNLKAVFVRRRETAMAIRAINRILVVTTDQITEIRDRGLLHHSMGNLARAATDLNYYLAYAGDDAADRDAVRTTIQEVSRRLWLHN